MAAARSLEAAALDATVFAVEQEARQLIAELSLDHIETVSAVRAALPELVILEAELSSISVDLFGLSEKSVSSYALVSGGGIRLAALNTQKLGILNRIDLLDRMLELDRREVAAEAALVIGEYEAAVEHTRSLLEIMVAAGKAIDVAVSTRTERLRKRMLGAVRRELRIALESKDGESVGRFCRLQAPLGEAEAAISTFSNFCLRELESASTLAQAGEQVPLRLSRLLKRAAALTRLSSRVICLDLPGTPIDAQLGSARRIYCGTVVLGSALATEYASAFGLATKATAAQWHLARPLTAGTEPNAETETEALSCERLLDELTALLRGAVQFDHFVQSHVRSCGAGAKKSCATNATYGADVTHDADKVVGAGAAEDELRSSEGFAKLATALIALSAQHSWASLSKALRLNIAAERTVVTAVHGKESKTWEARGEKGAWDATLARSELIDSSFYVLQRALRRAAHCCDIEIAAAALLDSSELVSKMLIETLQAELKQSLSSKLAGAALAGAQAIVKSAEGSAAGVAAGAALDQALDCTTSARLPASMLRALNALQLCVVCVPRLWAQARQEMLSAVPASAHTPLHKALAHAQASETTVQEALTAGLQQLVDMALPRLRPKLEGFANTKYLLANEEGLAAAEGSSFVGPLLLELNQFLDMLHPLLAPANFEELIQMLIGALAEKLEVMLLKKRFDLYGAMKLDHEIRMLSQGFAELTACSLRDKLARLSQMTTFINLDHELEIREIWSREGMRLSVAEAKAVMALRVETRIESNLDVETCVRGPSEQLPSQAPIQPRDSGGGRVYE